MASGQPPSFYHILMNPSSPHLPLPTSFVKRHLRNRILKDPILRSANGGYSWKLKMKKFDDDDDGFCFVNGWSKVVKDVGLLFGEFLLFKYVGAGVFVMHVYSVNGCEKILVPRSSNFKVDVEVSVEDDEVVFGEDDVEEDNDDDDDDMEFGVEEEEDYAEEDDEDGVDVELGDDGEDGDDSEDEDEDYVDVDGPDGDPYFVITISKRNKDELRLPPDLVEWATIKTKETITLKNDGGYEKEMPVRSYKQNNSTRYYVAEGWREFQQNNDISEGDECVLKFITSEDKLCLAKVTKKKPRVVTHGMDEEGEAEDAKEDDSNVDSDDIFDDDVDDEGNGENATFVNDEEDEDDDRDVDGDDGNPSFILTSSNKNQYRLTFSADFVALAGIHTKKTITLKNLDGYERKLRVRSRIWKYGIVHFRRRKHSKKSKTFYFLSAGWKEFQRNTNISVGDKFVFKFITSEDKFCLAKITKNKTRARPLPPAAEAPVMEVDDGMDDKDLDEGMDEEGNGEDAKFVVDDDEDNGVDVNGDEGKGETAKLVNDDMDDENDKAQDAKDGDSNLEGDDIFDDDVGEEGEGEDDKLVENDDVDMDDNDVDEEGKGEDAKFVADDDEDDDVDVNGDEGKGETTKLGNDDMDAGDDMDEDAKVGDSYVEVDNVDEEGEGEDDTLVENDGDPSFIATCLKTKQYNLWFSEDFVALAGINTKKTIKLKNLDGYEKELRVKSHRRKHGRKYFLSAGWKEFQRSSNISEGDKFVFKFITSEDKFCVAKINDEDVEDDKDENEDVEPVDDLDPFFVATIKSHRGKLGLPKDFVALAGIESKENIMMKSLDGNETQMSIQTDKRHRSTYYHLSVGWHAFKTNNNISEGDECVFKYITSEDKLCLAKITKKENVDDNKDTEFVTTISPSHKIKLRLPTDFVASAGIESKENITMKSLDGNETQMPIRMDTRYRLKQYYYFSVGWPAFMRSNNLSEGDECVFKYITSEDKMCLAKVTKEKTPIRLPSPAEVMKRKRGRLPPAAKIKMTAAENVKTRSQRSPPVEITVAEAVKRKRGSLPPSSPRVTKDVKRKREQR